MSTYTLILPARIGGGNIHDIVGGADRDIVFRPGCSFAVVASSYYGDHYTTHKTASAACAGSRRMRTMSHQIIDRHGKQYAVIPGRVAADDELICVGGAA